MAADSLGQTRPAPSPGRYDRTSLFAVCLPFSTKDLFAAGLVVTVSAADRQGHYWHWPGSPAPATQPSLAASAPRSTSRRGDLMFPMLLSPPHRGDDVRPDCPLAALTPPVAGLDTASRPRRRESCIVVGLRFASAASGHLFECYDAFNARSNSGAWRRYAFDVRDSLAATHASHASLRGIMLAGTVSSWRIRHHVAWWSDGSCRHGCHPPGGWPSSPSTRWIAEGRRKDRREASADLPPSSSNERRGMAHSHQPVKHQLHMTCMRASTRRLSATLSLHAIRTDQVLSVRAIASYRVRASCAREETSLSRRSASQQPLNTTG